MKLKKGDSGIVLTGKDKGKRGKVLRAMPKENKLILEGINMSKKHQRARNTTEKGSVISIAMPIHASNVRKA